MLHPATILEPMALCPVLVMHEKYRPSHAKPYTGRFLHAACRVMALCCSQIWRWTSLARTCPCCIPWRIRTHCAPPYIQAAKSAQSTHSRSLMLMQPACRHGTGPDQHPGACAAPCGGPGALGGRARPDHVHQRRPVPVLLPQQQVRAGSQHGTRHVQAMRAGGGGGGGGMCTSSAKSCHSRLHLADIYNGLLW